MTDARPPLEATLEWNSEQRFTGIVGKHEVGIDGTADSAPTPVQQPASDLVHILARGRHPVSSLTTKLTGYRADENPKRFTRIHLDFTLSGDVQPEHVERAIDLSREKYCSVWQTFRQDIELIVGFTIEG
jgi:putative redox protein